MSWFYKRDEKNYKLLNKKEKLSYKTHNRLDNFSFLFKSL